MKFTVDFMLSKLFPNVNNNPKKIAPRPLWGAEGDRKEAETSYGLSTLGTPKSSKSPDGLGPAGCRWLEVVGLTKVSRKILRLAGFVIKTHATMLYWTTKIPPNAARSVPTPT
jgi:hypothetical protein